MLHVLRSLYPKWHHHQLQLPLLVHLKCGLINDWLFFLGVSGYFVNLNSCDLLLRFIGYVVDVSGEFVDAMFDVAYIHWMRFAA